LETIAVYWEDKVKTYGFQLARKLSLLQVSIPAHQLAAFGSKLLNDTTDVQFKWVLVQPSSRQGLIIHLLLTHKWVPCMRSHIQQLRKNDIDLEMQVTSPVELVSFHGPHFGDRYGIADAALGTLHKEGLPILASGCSGASVYIVVPDQRSAEVANILSGVFETP
jgi:aspartokinase